MKFIELTIIAEINQKALVNMDLVQVVLDCIDHSILSYSKNDGTLSVKETPQEILMLIDGNEKQGSGWIENTGVQPCADDRMVFVMFADDSVLKGTADNWEWKKGGEYSVSKYKFESGVK